MAKKISILLNQTSIQKAIKELNAYKKQILSKNELFIQKLTDLGIPIIEQNILAAKGDSNKNHYTHIRINSFGGYCQATLTVEGRDILFMEFGAGIRYNGEAGTSPHPKGDDFGYTIGSYGKGQGKNDTWFYYADTGEVVASHGTEATMPVYKASIVIIENIRKIAKEVFGGK